MDVMDKLNAQVATGTPEELFLQGKADALADHDPRKAFNRKEQMVYSAGYYAGLAEKFNDKKGCNCGV